MIPLTTLLYGLFKIKIKTEKKNVHIFEFLFYKTSVNIKYVYHLLSSHTVCFLKKGRRNTSRDKNKNRKSI